MDVCSLDRWIEERTGLGAGLQQPDLYQWQLLQLQRQVKYAVDFSPFYQHFYQGEDLSHPENLPLLTAAQLVAGGQDLVCLPQNEIQRVVSLSSSGTEGLPKRIYFSAADLAHTRDFFAVGMAQMAVPGQMVLICLNGGVTDSVGSLLADVLLEMKITPFILGEIKDVVSAAAVAAALQPAVVVGLPRQILQLAKYLPSLRPESVLLTADNIDTLLRLEIGRLWQTKVLAHWGMTETGFGGGVECPGCTGYHIRHADLLIQIIDPDTGALLPVGAEGEIVVSTLNRQAMPVIRYRTGDISRLLATPCVCGSTLLRLGPVFGHRQNGYRTLG